MPIRGVAPYIPKMPNEGSEHQTPASLAIDLHYASLLITERWNWERYVRLCCFVKMTPWEVASIVRMPHAMVAHFKEEKTLVGRRGAHAITLLLTILEAHWYAGFTTDIIPDPFPTINQDEPCTIPPS